MSDLFLHPSRFFRAPYPLDDPWLLLPTLALLGFAGALDRLDLNLLRVEAGADPAGASIHHAAADSWATLWVYLLIAGLIAAVFRWYLGGWWYRVRLEWSDAKRPDPLRARLVYSYSGLVQALPPLLVLGVEFLRYDSYRAAWEASGSWTLLLLAFPYWAYVVSYRGVLATFVVDRGRARLWFLIAPSIYFTVVLGMLVVGLNLLAR